MITIELTSLIYTAGKITLYFFYLVGHAQIMSGWYVRIPYTVEQSLHVKGTNTVLQCPTRVACWLIWTGEEFMNTHFFDIGPIVC